MAGNLIAQAIVEGDQTWRQFTPFELVWAGGVFGRAAAQARAWIKRLRDGLEARNAKARERVQRQAEELEVARAAREAAAQAPIQATEAPELAPEATIPAIPAPAADLVPIEEPVNSGGSAALPVADSEQPAEGDNATARPNFPRTKPKRKKRRQAAKRKTEPAAGPDIEP
jgi:hypothetical protein